MRCFCLSVLLFLPLLSTAQDKLYRDPRQFVWRIEGNRLYRYDGYGERAFSPRDGLPEANIERLLFDRSQRLWLFGTHLPGLFYMDSTHVVRKVKSDAFLRDFSIDAAWQSGDTLFLRDAVTGVGLYACGGATEAKRLYKPVTPPPGVDFLSPDTTLLFEPDTRSIRLRTTHSVTALPFAVTAAQALNADTWLAATPNGGLWTATPNGTKRPVKLRTAHLPEFRQGALMPTELAADRLFVYIGCEEGLFFTKRQTDMTQGIALHPADYNITIAARQRLSATGNYLRIGRVFQVLPVPEGVLLATENGLFLLEPTLPALQRLSPGYEDAGAVAHRTVYAAADEVVWPGGRRTKTNGRVAQLAMEHQSGIVFGATERGGIFYGKDGVVQSLRGTEDQRFTQIKADGIGQVWALSEGQLVKISVVQNVPTVRCFDVPEGTRGFALQPGALVFWGSGGLSTLPVAQLRGPDTPPNLLLESVKIGGVERPAIRAYENLETGQRTAIVRVMAVSPLSQGRMLYRYRLGNQPFWPWESTDTARWEYTRNREIIQPLHAGRFQLDIEATDHYGIATVEPLRIRFQVLPPWWQRWWAFGLLTALTGSGLYAVFKNRERQLHQKNERLELQKNLAEVELKALQAQMNTHFVANALTAIQGFVMRNDKEKANRYIVNFYTLVRLFLDSSRRNAHSLDKEIDLLESYVQLQQLFYPFEYSLEIGPDIYMTEMDVPTALYQPLVENAIVHGLRHRPAAGAQLAIRFERTKNTLSCCIEDNGVGRERSYQINQSSSAYRKFSTQISTQIIRKRMETLNENAPESVSIQYADLYDDEPQHPGTRVTVTIRLDNPAEMPDNT